MADLVALARLDLNLLVSLDALLTERNVTRAAARLHLSQPALSGALARLRVHFGDQLLVRSGNNYELTPLAARLAGRTESALDAARRVFESQATWSPAESEREFLISGSDHSLATIAPIVSRLAREQAPNVRFRFALHTPALLETALRMPASDGLLLPHGVLANLAHTDLDRDDWVAIVATDGPHGAELTLDALARAPWAFTYDGRSAFTFAGRQLQQLGLDPRIEVVVESFVVLPLFVEGTDRIGIVHRRLAARATALGAVRAVELPFPAVPVVNALWWHPVHRHDPDHVWMRQQFTRASELLIAEHPDETRVDQHA